MKEYNSLNDNKKYSILFVCLGNICRSPAAEEIFRTYAYKAGLSCFFKIDSAGLINFHQGESPDSRMKSHAAKRGYQLTHLSRPIMMEDFSSFNLIIGMDQQNMQALYKICPASDRDKLVCITRFCARWNVSNVPDPYYGNDTDFENVLNILEDACQGLLNHLPVTSDGIHHSE